MEWLTTHVLAWTVTAASTLTVAQMFTPTFMDWILDFLVVGLVWAAARLAAYNVKAKS